LETTAAAPFPTRFEVKYSLEEALRYGDAKSRSQSAAAGSGHTWSRLTVLALLVSGLSLLAEAAGLVAGSAVPAVATLFGLAFILGLYAAWMEVGNQSKRIARTLHASDDSLGVWHVTVTDDVLEATARGDHAVRMRLAAIREVTVDDMFVVISLDPAWDFAIPRRCLGGDREVEAFKNYLDARRAGPSSAPNEHVG
jgi:hypothetical protein